MRKSKDFYFTPSSQSLNSYIKQIKKHPLISPQEERELAEKVFYHNDNDALYRLVVCNLRYVVKVAKNYSSYAPHIDLLDLIQEGNLGLIHAITKFNPTKGYRLLTYATCWIRAYIQRTINKSLSVVKQSSGYGDGCGMFSDISLDSPIENSNGLTFMEVLQDTNSHQDEEFIDNERLDIAEKAMDTLNNRERYIIENRFIVLKPKTLNELGSEFGVSREYIRQLEEKAKKKMHQYVCNY